LKLLLTFLLRFLLYSDIKPKNIMRKTAHYMLIDLDASAAIATGLSGAKYSSAYLPPELIALGDDGVYRVKTFEEVTTNGQRKIVAAIGSNGQLDLVAAHPAHDAWSYGIVMFELVSGRKMFHCNFDDNIFDTEQYHLLFNFTDEFKNKQLGSIADNAARNLLSQLLSKNPLQRPSMLRILNHPFLTGKAAARMIGEPPEFDVFLSYRVASDSAHVEIVYKLLSAAGVKVWWDKECLEPGVPWEEGKI